MLIFDKLRNCFNGFLSKISKYRNARKDELLRGELLTIAEVEKPPKNVDIEKGKIYFVVPQAMPKWALLQCPCGCNAVITLSLQQVHIPHWSLTRSPSNLPNLYPSVWRDIGCYSHFWIKDGRILWCPDSGTKPRPRPFGDQN